MYAYAPIPDKAVVSKEWSFVPHIWELVTMHILRSHWVSGVRNSGGGLRTQPSVFSQAYSWQFWCPHKVVWPKISRWHWYCWLRLYISYHPRRLPSKASIMISLLYTTVCSHVEGRGSPEWGKYSVFWHGHDHVKDAKASTYGTICPSSYLYGPGSRGMQSCPRQSKRVFMKDQWVCAKTSNCSPLGMFTVWDCYLQTPLAEISQVLLLSCLQWLEAWLCTCLPFLHPCS